jgi:hypothetical protein
MSGDEIEGDIILNAMMKVGWASLDSDLLVRFFLVLVLATNLLECLGDP